MNYRPFGKLDWEVSTLGFGVQRLPLEDEVGTIGMLRYAIDRGVNYIDLGFAYDRERQERLTGIVREALRDGCREKVNLAAGVPSFMVKGTADLDRFLDDQLRWLGADGIDFYLLGGLDRYTWLAMKELGAVAWLEKAVSGGRIGAAGFSFRDQFQFLREVLDDYDGWALGRFQYSYMDVDHHPGTSGLKLAAERGLAVVAAEALRGGRLAKNPPDSVAAIWADAAQQRTPAEWGLRFAWNQPEIAVVVSDMSSWEQVEENIALAGSVEPGTLSIREQIVIGRARDAYRALRPINCTACRACMPCPQDIDAPRVFELYNDAVMYGDAETGRSLYRIERHDVTRCNDCGLCAGRCGRNIPLPDWLKRVGEVLG